MVLIYEPSKEQHRTYEERYSQGLRYWGTVLFGLGAAVDGLKVALDPPCNFLADLLAVDLV